MSGDVDILDEAGCVSGSFAAQLNSPADMKKASKTVEINGALCGASSQLSAEMPTILIRFVNALN